MALSGTEIAIIAAPLLSLLAIIYTWYKTRIKGASFLILDFHITGVSKATRDGEEVSQMTSTFEILNTGDRKGFLRFERAEISGRLNKPYKKEKFQLKQAEYEPPLVFTLDGGISTSRGFTFETKDHFKICGWDECKLTAKGTYINHKGKIQTFKMVFVGPQEKDILWRSLIATPFLKAINLFKILLVMTILPLQILVYFRPSSLKMKERITIKEGRITRI